MSTEPSPTSWLHDEVDPAKGQMQYLMTPMAAQRILGEEPIMTGGSDGVTYAGSEQYVEVTLQAHSHTPSDRGALIEDAKRSKEQGVSDWKKLPELGHNAFMEWTPDDALGGTSATISWGEGTGKGYVARVGGLPPSKTKDLLLKEVLRIHKTFKG